MSDKVPIVGPNYLYINELEIPPGRTPNECIEEAIKWVKALREGGEFKSVRLYIHNTGPMFALYLLAEPNDWASMEKGFEKALTGLGVMEKPWNWGRHTDNLISEIPVD
jgi:hypothetical protein